VDDPRLADRVADNLHNREITSRCAAFGTGRIVRVAEERMPKYLVTATYTAEGAKGLLKDRGSKRRQAIEAAVPPGQ
jgi:hypothetical protein